MPIRGRTVVRAFVAFGIWVELRPEALSPAIPRTRRIRHVVELVVKLDLFASLVTLLSVLPFLFSSFSFLLFDLSRERIGRAKLWLRALKLEKATGMQSYERATRLHAIEINYLAVPRYVELEFASIRPFFFQFFPDFLARAIILN